ncbi:ABC-2 type transport system permease protein [Gracilibacillus orientalis]|uniref:Transport permease protein n=1 Tax=Gracilibacillus orientalis TaxID=334253 RepID=A0A1I4Q337_9BACI|nr:ABC transporter permease [Gracilibacillus orientalis]SFM34276.1 ABC-2 type transport system permease protein [Gracilibacillus orientalis]
MEITNKFSDTKVMIGRSMRLSFRSLDTMITTIAMPIMIMFVFVYIFGGAIETGYENYVNYLVPAIILMTIATGGTYTSVRLSDDINKGIIDRFRSMPIAKSSLLSGYVWTSVVFNSLSTFLVIGCAFFMGFRPGANIGEWLLVIGMLILFILVISWISVLSALLAKTVEGAASYGYLVLLLIFISSAFVPTDSMPNWIRVFADNQPMTSVLEAVRNLLMSEPVGNHIWVSVLWLLGLLFVTYIASVQVFKRKTS